MARPTLPIAIIGAGPAGVAAAFSAASTGQSVTLIEATSRVGGSVTAAMHRCLCGLYSHTPQSPLDTLNDGSQRQVVAHMMQHDPANVYTKVLGKTTVLEFPAAAYEASLLSLCSAPNIHRLMDTRLTAVHRKANKITAIEIHPLDPIKPGQSPGRMEISAIIDCTGSGALLQIIGQDVMHPPDPARMLGGYSLKLKNLTGDPEILRLQLPYALTKAVNANTLPRQARFTMFHPGPGHGEGICKLAIHPDDFASDHLPALANQIIDYLRKALPAFAKVEIADASPTALPRDGRRLKGKATVTEDDVLQARQIAPDAVHAWWPIEHWDIATGPSYAYPPNARHYDIPDEAMQSAIIENLFAAGTCVSATAIAAASLRASGICLATGQAAGRLAGRQNSHHKTRTTNL